MISDSEIEQELQEKGLTAARITLQDIEAQIDKTYFFTAGDGVAGCYTYPDIGTEEEFEPLGVITICVIIMKNGHKIVGVNEGPVSKSNFDAEIGKRLACQNAIDKIWPLLGYELRTKQFNGG